jgi:hypothetical protein
MQWIDADPYGFLLWDEQEWPALSSVAPPPPLAQWAYEPLWEPLRIDRRVAFDFASGIVFRPAAPSTLIANPLLPFFDPVRLKQPIISDPILVPRQAIVPQDIAVVSYFEPVRLKRPIITDQPVLFKPVVPIISGIVFTPLFDPIKLKPPIETLTGPFRGTSPPLTIPYITREFFDPIRLKQPIISDPLLIPYNTSAPEGAVIAAFFDPVRLKQPIISDQPVLFIPVVPVISGIVFASFFDPIKLKIPVEVVLGPFAGTSPPVAGLRLPDFIFDTVKLKAPVESLTGPFQPLVQPVVTVYSLSNWFEPVRPKRPQDERPIGAVPLSITAGVGSAWFEPTRANRISVGFLDLPKPPPSSGIAPYLTGAYTDSIRLRQTPGAETGFNFTFAPKPVVPTIQNALTDWYAISRKVAPIIDQPVVVFYPAQVLPSIHIIQRTLTGVGL